MKTDRRNIKEPFEPEDTPKPPQIIEPNSDRQRENPVKDETRDKNQTAKKGPDQETSNHLLGDDTDISDETTI